MYQLFLGQDIGKNTLNCCCLILYGSHTKLCHYTVVCMMEPTTLADAQYQWHNTDKHLVDTTVQNSGFYSAVQCRQGSL